MIFLHEKLNWEDLERQLDQGVDALRKSIEDDFDTSLRNYKDKLFKNEELITTEYLQELLDFSEKLQEIQEKKVLSISKEHTKNHNDFIIEMDKITDSYLSKATIYDMGLTSRILLQMKSLCKYFPEMFIKYTEKLKQLLMQFRKKCCKKLENLSELEDIKKNMQIAITSISDLVEFFNENFSELEEFHHDILECIRDYRDFYLNKIKEFFNNQHLSLEDIDRLETSYIQISQIFQIIFKEPSSWDDFNIEILNILEQKLLEISKEIKDFAMQPFILEKGSWQLQNLQLLTKKILFVQKLAQSTNDITLPSLEEIKNILKTFMENIGSGTSTNFDHSIAAMEVILKFNFLEKVIPETFERIYDMRWNAIKNLIKDLFKNSAILFGEWNRRSLLETDKWKKVLEKMALLAKIKNFFWKKSSKLKGETPEMKVSDIYESEILDLENNFKEKFAELIKFLTGNTQEFGFAKLIFYLCDLYEVFENPDTANLINNVQFSLKEVIQKKIYETLKIKQENLSSSFKFIQTMDFSGFQIKFDSETSKNLQNFTEFKKIKSKAKVLTEFIEIDDILKEYQKKFSIFLNDLEIGIKEDVHLFKFQNARSKLNFIQNFKEELDDFMDSNIFNTFYNENKREIDEIQRNFENNIKMTLEKENFTDFYELIKGISDQSQWFVQQINIDFNKKIDKMISYVKKNSRILISNLLDIPWNFDDCNFLNSYKEKMEFVLDNFKDILTEHTNKLIGDFLCSIQEKINNKLKQIFKNWKKQIKSFDFRPSYEEEFKIIITAFHEVSGKDFERIMQKKNNIKRDLNKLIDEFQGKKLKDLVKSTGISEQESCLSLYNFLISNDNSQEFARIKSILCDKIDEKIRKLNEEKDDEKRKKKIQKLRKLPYEIRSHCNWKEI